MSLPAVGPDPVQGILDQLEGVRGSGPWTALCPAHEDRNASLSIKRGDNGDALVFCHAGCDTRDVLAAVDLTLADLYPDGRDRPRDQWRRSGQTVKGARPRLAPVPDPKRRPEAKAAPPTLGPEVARYDYRDESGAVLFTKIRFEPKDFRVRRPGQPGGIGDARRVLYRLPELLAAVKAGETVYVVEGEKDADRLACVGLVATCNFDGAAKLGSRAKWRPEYGDQLAGAHVVIVRDLDDAVDC